MSEELTPEQVLRDLPPEEYTAEQFAELVVLFKEFAWSVETTQGSSTRNVTVAAEKVTEEDTIIGVTGAYTGEEYEPHNKGHYPTSTTALGEAAAIGRKITEVLQVRQARPTYGGANVKEESKADIKPRARGVFAIDAATQLLIRQIARAHALRENNNKLAYPSWQF